MFSTIWSSDKEDKRIIFTLLKNFSCVTIFSVFDLISTQLEFKLIYYLFLSSISITWRNRGFFHCAFLLINIILIWVYKLLRLPRWHSSNQIFIKFKILMLNVIKICFNLWKHYVLRWALIIHHVHHCSVLLILTGVRLILFGVILHRVKDWRHFYQFHCAIVRSHCEELAIKWKLHFTWKSKITLTFIRL